MDEQDKLKENSILREPARSEDSLAELAAGRLRVARRTLPMILAFTVCFGIIFIWLYFLFEQPWQWNLLIATVVQGLIFFTLAYLQARRGNIEATVYLTVLGINLAALIGSVMLEGWLFQGLMLTFVSMTFARLLASRLQNRWVVVLSAVTMILAIILSALEIFEPLALPPVWELGLRMIYVPAGFLVIALIMDSRDERYENALLQSDAYATELAAQREALQERATELTKRARYLQATTEVARNAAAAQLDPQVLLTRVAELVSEEFDWYHTGIFLLDPTEQWAVLQAASSEGGKVMLNRGHRLRVGQTGTVGYVTSRGVPRIALDVGEDAVFFNNPDLPETRSAMTLPLIARGEIIGALDVQSKESGAFSDEDATVVQALADQVALAISNSRLLEQVEHSLEAERLALGEASRASWRELLQTQSRVGFRYEEGIVFPASVVEDMSEEEIAVESERVEDEESPEHEPSMENALPELELPVSARGQVLGVLKAHKTEAAGAWTQDEIVLMETLLEQLEVALDSARLYQDTQLRAHREQLTRQITANIRSAPSIEDAIKRAMRDIAQVVGVSDMATRIGPLGSSVSGRSQLLSDGDRTAQPSNWDGENYE